MKIYEHEGKRYIEYNKVFIIILTALICFIIGFFIMIYVLYSYSAVIFDNPLIYGAKMYNVTLCSCTASNNVYFTFDKYVIKKKVESNPNNLFYNVTIPNN